MGWKIIEIETDEYIQLYLNNLMIKRKNEKILINLRDIDTLILKNERMQISCRLLNAIANANINLILMNGLHIPNAHFMPIVGHHASLKIFEKQISWNKTFKGKCWQKIIMNKIKNQSKFLERNNNVYDSKKLNDLMIETKVFDISNREGHASKIYWHALYGKDFIRDQKCNKNSLINTMLNYGYAILRSLVVRAIYKKGLDPRISFYHKSFSNFFALASDVMEPFRPLIDQIVFSNREAVIFNIEIRNKLIDVLDHKVKINEKMFYIEKGIEIIFDNLIKENGWTWVDLWD